MKHYFACPLKLLWSGVLLSILCSCNASGMREKVKDIESESHLAVDEEYYVISQEKAKEMMDTMEGYVIVDVRTKEEYDAGHIPGAVCIPNETIETEPPGLLSDKEQPIFVYCRSGNRSKQAVKKLAAMGYTNLYEFGGIQTWEYETEVSGRN